MESVDLTTSKIGIGTEEEIFLMLIQVISQELSNRELCHPFSGGNLSVHHYYKNSGLRQEILFQHKSELWFACMENDLSKYWGCVGLDLLAKKCISLEKAESAQWSCQKVGFEYKQPRSNPCTVLMYSLSRPLSKLPSPSHNQAMEILNSKLLL